MMINDNSNNQNQQFLLATQFFNAVKQRNVSLASQIVDQWKVHRSPAYLLQSSLGNMKLLGRCNVLHISVMLSDLPMIHFLFENVLGVPRALLKTKTCSAAVASSHDEQITQEQKQIILELLQCKSSINQRTPLHIAASLTQSQNIFLSNNELLVTVEQQQQSQEEQEGNEAIDMLPSHLEQHAEQLENNDSLPILMILLNLIVSVTSSNDDKTMKSENSGSGVDRYSLLNMVDEEGMTPILSAIMAHSPVHVIDAMIHYGCDINTRDSNGRNALHLAIIRNHYYLVKYLLKYMERMEQHVPLEERPKNLLRIDERDTIDGYNALHLAAQVGSSRIAEQLIVSPLNGTLESLLLSNSLNGKTPYHIAVDEQKMEVAALISQVLPPKVVEEMNRIIDRRNSAESEEYNQNVTVEQVSNDETNAGTSENDTSMQENDKLTVTQESIEHGDERKHMEDTHEDKRDSGSFMLNYFSSIKQTLSDTYKKTKRVSQPEPPRIGKINADTKKDKIKKTHFDMDHDGITEYVKSLGYPCERHHVMTDDGYVIYMYRIPYGKSANLLNIPQLPISTVEQPQKKRPVVYLQHGVCNSSSTWVVTGESQGLAFILAMNGFDVWMGNNRGTQFGRIHSKLDHNSPDFWKFSWDQMAKYDLPAQINYVLQTTGATTLSYIGHSQGTAQAFAAFSTNEDLQSKVNLFIALAPVVCLKHQSSQIFKILASLKTETLITMLGIGEIAQTQISRSLLPALAAKLIGTTGFNDLWSLFMDCDIDHAALPILTQYEPSPTSSQNLAHWSQLVRSGTFHAFDYGEAENLKLYGQATPQIYDLKSIHIPVAAFYGDLDYLANPIDIESFLLKELPNVVKAKKIENFKHNDFVWGRNAWEKVYHDVVELLMNVSSTPTSE